MTDIQQEIEELKKRIYTIEKDREVYAEEDEKTLNRQSKLIDKLKDDNK